MGEPIKIKTQMRFGSEDALRDVERVIQEAAAVVNDTIGDRLIKCKKRSIYA